MSLKHLIIFSLYLLTITLDAKAAPGDSSKAVSKDDEEHKSEPKQVQLIKVSDSYVVVRLLFKPQPKKEIKTNLVYAIEKTNKKGVNEWVYSDKDASIAKIGIAYNVIARAVVGGYYQYDMKVSNIQPDSKIKIKFTVIWESVDPNDKNKRIKDAIGLEEIEVKTKPKAPVTRTSSPLLSLEFENSNAVKYFAKVIKIQEGKETDCVLEVSMSSCFGNSVGLPELVSGEKYAIKVWYIKDDATESEVTTQEITA